MKRLAPMFRGQGEEQKYSCEVGESEMRALERVDGVPAHVIEMIVNLHRTAERLNEFLAENHPGVNS